MNNLNDEARKDLISAAIYIESAKKIGFQDGFIGESAKNISPYIDQQNAYFGAYQEGKKHREDVEQICSRENISINELMKKAFYYYKESKYETPF